MDMKKTVGLPDAPLAVSSVPARCTASERIAAVEMQLARLKAICRSEPGGNGATLCEDPRFRRRITELEIATLTLRWLEPRCSPHAAAIFELGSLELTDRLDEALFEAVGPYAAPSHASLGHNARVGPAYARGMAEAYISGRIDPSRHAARGRARDAIAASLFER